MRKDEALHYAESVFDGYALHHANKGDFEKAEANRTHAMVMRDALATVSNSLTAQTQDALRLAEEAIMDELEAVTAEEFEDVAGKLDDALRAIWKALAQPTVRDNLIVQSQDALRLAEEALTDLISDSFGTVSFPHNTIEAIKANKALSAIRKAPVHPVNTSAKRVDETVECGHEPTMRRTTRDEKIVRPGVYEVPVKQEPVAWVNADELDNLLDDRAAIIEGNRSMYRATPLYTTPQPRLDVDLTDDEVEEVTGCNKDTPLWLAVSGIARAVIAKLQEKEKLCLRK